MNYKSQTMYLYFVMAIFFSAMCVAADHSTPIQLFADRFNEEYRTMIEVLRRNGGDITQVPTLVHNLGNGDYGIVARSIHLGEPSVCVYLSHPSVQYLLGRGFYMYVNTSEGRVRTFVSTDIINSQFRLAP